MKKKEIIKIIEEWYSGLGYTQGIVVNLKKVCSNYDISDLIDRIKKLKGGQHKDV